MRKQRLSSAVRPGSMREYARRMRAPLCVGTLALIFVDLLDLILPLILKRGFDAIQAHAPLELVQSTAYIYLGVAATQALLRFIYRRTLTQVYLGIGHDLRLRIARKIVGLPVSEVQRVPVGQYLTLTSSDAEQVAAPFDTGIIMFFDGVLYLVVAIGISLWLAPQISLLIFAPLFLIPLIMNYSQKRIRSQSAQVQSVLTTMTNQIHESLHGIEFLKSIGGERRAADYVGEGIQQFRDEAIALTRREAQVGPRLELTAAASTALLIVVGGSQLMAGNLSLGTFVALQRYIDLLSWPLQALAFWIAMMQRGQMSSERIGSLLDKKELLIGDHSTNIATTGALTVSELNYTYPDQSHAALQDISFSVKQGEKIAVLGDTGSGKSTLLQIIAGTLPSSPGAILWNGSIFSPESSSEHRALVSMATQESFLFSGTVTQNLNAGSVADPAHVQSLCAVLGISSLNEESRLVGEQGVLLSGGQRQRVACGRALLKPAPILLLDDPLSAVDSEQEARIIEGLAPFLDGRAVIFTTGRLNLLKLADKIIVLDSGRIIEIGTFDTLYADSRSWLHSFVAHCQLLERVDPQGLSLNQGGVIHE